MASIPLPALGIRPPEQQPNALQTLAQIQQLRQQQALMPGQIEAQRQQIQAGQLENQQRQQQLKDQQAATSAMQEWDGKDIKDLPPLMLKHGASANAVFGMKKNILDQQEKYSTIAKNDSETGAKNLETLKGKNDLVLGALKTANDIPDEQLGQHLAQTVQGLTQQGVLDPQHAQQAAGLIQGLQSGQLKPEQARQALSIFEKSLQGNSQQLDQAAKQAETAKNAAEATKTGMETDFMKQFGGMNQAMADSKYRFLQQQEQLGNKLGPQDQAFVQAYEKQKLLVPVASAKVRIEGLGQIREYPVIDSKTGSLQYLSATDLNKANQAEPGRYAPAGEGSKAMGKTALIEDIRGNIQSVRDALNNPKMPEFSAPQRAEIAIALGKPDSQGALSAAFRGGVLGSLTPEQQDYLITMAQLKENAMAMRSVLGAGQGSEDMRAAITATIPGPRTPTKEFALKQLQAFEAVLNRLQRGVPNVPLAPAKGATQPNGAQPTGGGGTVLMRAPNGQTRPVPADQVDHFKSKGAVVVNQ